MDGFDPMSSFGPDVAAEYDDELRGDEDAAADLLAELAGDGTALELAIGTGRIAVPLMDRGVEVDGIEQSRAMADRLLAKRPDTRVVIGDMASADAPRSGYRLVFLVFNTIGNLLTQDDQVRCFQNAARHLADDGVFVVENLVPTAHVTGRGQFVDAERVTADEVVLDVNRYDPVTQLLEENHVSISARGIRMGPIAQRLTFPSELDLMARLAGLRLLERWGGFDRTPFTSRSEGHVSVWTRAC
jgi:SAM-dependent methyltransferase